MWGGQLSVWNQIFWSVLLFAHQVLVWWLWASIVNMMEVDWCLCIVCVLISLFVETNCHFMQWILCWIVKTKHSLWYLLLGSFWLWVPEKSNCAFDFYKWIIIFEWLRCFSAKLSVLRDYLSAESLCCRLYWWFSDDLVQLLFFLLSLKYTMLFSCPGRRHLTDRFWSWKTLTNAILEVGRLISFSFKLLQFVFCPDEAVF